jgi:integrase
MSGRRTFGNARRLPSGRWQAQYRHEGKRYTAPCTFVSKADANAFLSNAETDVRRGGWIDPGLARTPFSVVATGWLASGTSKRTSSVDRDRSIVDTHLQPIFGDRAIGSIKPSEVQSVVDKWAASYAPSTVGRHYASLRAICGFAEASEMILRSPCRGIRLPKVSPVERPDLENSDLETLAEALGSEQGAFMWCGAVLGLRWSEVAGLTVDRLDVLSGRITVDRQLSRTGELASPKSHAGTRTLTCPSWLLEELASILARKGLTAAEGERFVFANSDEVPLDYTNWRRRVWVPACTSAKLTGLRFHDLRSLAATALIASGVDVKTAQKRLGHSSARMTLDVYARVTAQAERDAGTAVGNYLRPSRFESPG